MGVFVGDGWWVVGGGLVERFLQRNHEIFPFPIQAEATLMKDGTER